MRCCKGALLSVDRCGADLLEPYGTAVVFYLPGISVGSGHVVTAFLQVFQLRLQSKELKRTQVFLFWPLAFIALQKT